MKNMYSNPWGPAILKILQRMLKLGNSTQKNFSYYLISEDNYSRFQALYFFNEFIQNSFIFSQSSQTGPSLSLAIRSSNLITWKWLCIRNWPKMSCTEQFTIHECMRPPFEGSLTVDL